MSTPCWTRGLDEAKNSGPPTADILQLTESMQAAPPFHAVLGPADVAFSDTAEPDPPPPSQPRPEPPLPDRALMSPRTSAVVDMAFNKLAHTVLVQNSRTLEDLVR